MDVRPQTSLQFNPGLTGHTTGSLPVELFLPLIVQPVSTNTYATAAPHSYYHVPIDTEEMRLRGHSRNFGHASSAVQAAVMQQIMAASEDLSPEDRALLLGIARIESGYNPDAAATTTSAAGIFQFVKATGAAYGLDDRNRFSSKSNIVAGVQLFKDNAKLVAQRWPTAHGAERAVLLYALHHDGPSLAYGGAEIAREKLIPLLPRLRCFVDDYLAASAATTSSTSYG